eukprot:1254473-Ditylum_brightwellii.AAC.1
MEQVNFLHKVDSEINLIQREFITRKTTKYSEEHKYLVDEWSGEREGRASIGIMVLKQFTAETHHYQHSNAGMADCNTKACYDRITPELLTLLYTKVGCPSQ